MQEHSVIRTVIGLDQGDRYSHVCVLDRQGRVTERERIPTTQAGYRKYFEARRGRKRTRVVLEVGSQSPWSSRLLSELGYEVVVANARRVRLIAEADRKSDRVDAETLARLGRVDPELLAPIRHGGESFQRDRSLLTAREGLVRCRVRLILQARGLTKAQGQRLPRSSARAFPKRVRESGLADAWPGLSQVLIALETLNEQIQELDQEIELACRERYPQTKLLRQVQGVGPITALAFVLKVEDPKRFAKSREVGPFLSLVPRKRQSGDLEPQLGIPRRGDAMVRRLLIQSAHYILGPFGPDTELRRFGLRKFEQGGKRARKRAVVAVARKLGVLLHRLWVTGEAYEPLGYAGSEERAV